MAQWTLDDGAREHGAKALAAMDRVIEDRPQSVQPACLEMTNALVRLRDALIERHRDGRNVSRHLAHTNAVISLVFSIQYPLEGVPGEKLKEARDALAKLIDEMAQS